MRTTNKIGIFLASIIVIAGCQMGDDKGALQSATASPSPTIDFIELSSNSVSGTIGITDVDDIPVGFAD